MISTLLFQEKYIIQCIKKWYKKVWVRLLIGAIVFILAGALIASFILFLWYLKYIICEKIRNSTYRALSPIKEATECVQSKDCMLFWQLQTATYFWQLWHRSSGPSLLPLFEPPRTYQLTNNGADTSIHVNRTSREIRIARQNRQVTRTGF